MFLILMTTRRPSPKKHAVHAKHVEERKKNHLKDFLAISENFENFHVELANQPMLSYRGGG